MSVSASNWTATASETNGGHTTASTPGGSCRSRNAMQNSAVSAGGLNIFQLPAISIRRDLPTRPPGSPDARPPRSPPMANARTGGKLSGPRVTPSRARFSRCLGLSELLRRESASERVDPCGELVDELAQVVDSRDGVLGFDEVAGRDAEDVRESEECLQAGQVAVLPTLNRAPVRVHPQGQLFVGPAPGQPRLANSGSNLFGGQPRLTSSHLQPVPFTHSPSARRCSDEQ